MKLRPQPTVLPVEDEQIMLENIIGMLFVEAVDYAQKFGYVVRTTHVDGFALIGTRDLKRNRINLKIRNEKVEKATIG